ncbi:MAG: glycosyltransferase family 4 protein [Deltaproteobacteria bacterium]|nr:glycosyltransferase family 4 protein [Deltaproteobacteria bacterium]
MGVPGDRLLVSHLGYDPKDFEPRLSRTDARKQLGWPEGKRTVVYTGHLGRGKGIEALHALAARIPEADFRVVGGTDAQVAHRIAQVRSAGLENVFHHPFVTIDRVPLHLFAGDVLIVPPTSVPLRKYGNTVLPIKLYTYLAAGRPIVAPRLKDIEELIVDGDNGVLVPPDDPDEAAQRLSSVLSDDAGMRRLEMKSLALAPRFSWENRGKDLLEFIQARIDALKASRNGG